SGLIVPIVVNLVGEDDFGEAEGFVSGCKQIIDILAQFAGAGLILVLSYAALAWINSLTFLLAAILFALVGRKATPVQTETAETPAFWPAMRQAYQQAKKQTGLLTVVLVLAVINASLTAIEPLFSITFAAHKSSMVISSYSFTLALTNVAAAIGAASGSIFGQKIFRSVNIFLLASWTALCSLLTTLSLFCQNSWLTALLFGLLAALASTVSIKMTQWLVTSVDRQILASTVGLLNTILMAASPLITTLITSISSLSLAWAIISLLALEVAALAVLLVLSQRQLFKISA
ncbi:MAG: MFS transporter, partial [Limosilactobacillus reuteri]|nr:MFS transporter [Limosilactobacillus reuteri]